MKKLGKILLWILGIIAWFFLFMILQMSDMTHGTSSHLLLLTITGICLALYIWKKTGSKTKEIERENQELKAEIQKLRQELAEQAVRHAMDKAESREKKN